MVGVAQLVELRIVIPVVAGSIPVAHPIYWDQIDVYWDQIGVEQAALGWCAWAILASSIQHSAFPRLLTEHWLRRSCPHDSYHFVLSGLQDWPGMTAPRFPKWTRLWVAFGCALKVDFV